MAKLVKLYEGFYFAKGKDAEYTLKTGDIGIYGRGECYRLCKGDTTLGCFVTKTDYNNCEDKYSVESRLWTINDLVDKANSIIQTVESM